MVKEEQKNKIKITIKAYFLYIYIYIYSCTRDEKTVFIWGILKNIQYNKMFLIIIIIYIH